MRLRLQLLGAFALVGPDGAPLALPTRKAQALVAYLGARAGRPATRDHLAALLWGEAEPEAARHSLRQTLTSVRRVAPSLLTSEGDRLWLAPEGCEVDLAELERCAASGDGLERVEALYRGDLLEGLATREDAFEEWLTSERERLRALAGRGLATLLAELVAKRSTARGIAVALRLLALDPLAEPTHRALMRLYVEDGRRGAALRQFQTLKRVLGRELAVAPDAETRSLYEAIRREGVSGGTSTSGSTSTSRSPSPSPSASPSPSPSPSLLVGREAERAALRAALAAAWSGEAGVALVVGEAGLGKTRLVEELAAEARARGGHALLGRCFTSEQILPFAPWVGALREVVAALAAPLAPAWRAELARLFPDLEPARARASGASEHLRLFEALARVVERAAEDAPLLVWLEDLHWADEMSVRLLLFLGRRLRASPVLIVATLRADEASASAHLAPLLDELARDPRSVRVTLGPLSLEDTARLLAGSASADVDEIWRVSEGNPLLVHELARALGEGDAAPRGATARDLGHQVIGRRLERLSERARHFMELAALFGRTLDLAVLERAAGLHAAETSRVLDELVAHRVLASGGDGLDFTHERVREVAEARIPAAQRPLFHGRIAVALEAVHAGDLERHAPALGLHFREARSWEQASRHLRRAGEQSFVRHAYRDAVTWLGHAEAALERCGERRDVRRESVDLQLALRNALFPLGAHAEIRTRLERARRLADALGDRRRLGWIAAFECQAGLMLFDHGPARAAGERALALADGDPALAQQATFYLAQLHISVGDFRRAAELGRALVADDPARPASDSLVVSLARLWLCWALAELGDFAEAEALADLGDARAAAEEHPLPRLLARLARGLVHFRKGELDQASEALREALARCDASGYLVWHPAIASPLGACYAASGRLAEALPLLVHAVEQSVALRGVEHALRVTHLGEAELAGGRVEEARALATRALELARAQGDRSHEAYALRLVAALAAIDDVAAGVQRYRETLALAEALGLRPLAARAHLELGQLLRAQGQTAAARHALGHARRIAEATGLVTRLHAPPPREPGAPDEAP